MRKPASSFLLLLFILPLFFFIIQPVKVGVAQSQFITESDIVNRIERNSSGSEDYLWNTMQYRMLIIAPNETDFITQLQDYAEFKKMRGVPSVVISNWSLYSGRDDPEKIRNAIKYYYEKYPIQYVLLAGSTSKIPIRYVYNPDSVIVQEASEPLGANQYYKPTDYYYAALEGDWNIDEDDKWGEASQHNSFNLTDEIVNWEPQVYVGRLPAENSDELSIMLNKSRFYQEGQNAGEWMNRIFFGSGISNLITSGDLDGEDEAILSDYVIKNYVENSMKWSHAFESTSQFPGNPNYKQGSFSNLSASNFAAHINAGGSLFLWAGHGEPTRFAPLISSGLSVSDVQSLTNAGKYGVLFADACATNMYDMPPLSMGEAWIKGNNSGGIGYIGGLRITWYFTNDTNLMMLNRGVTKYFFDQFFNYDVTKQGDALYKSKIQYINGEYHSYSNINFTLEWERKIIQTYMLLGDPEIDIFTNATRSITRFFNDTMYEGSNINLVVRDEFGNPVKDPVVTIFSSDGKYRVFQGQKMGYVSIKLPLGIRTYNYTVFGHNVVYQNGTFTTLADESKPVLLASYELSPKNPKLEDTIQISINSTDYESGISNVYLILTDTTKNYSDFQIYEMKENLLHPTRYEIDLKYLKPNQYRFSFVIFDYADNFIIEYFGPEYGFLVLSMPVEYFFVYGVNFIGLTALITTGVYSMKYKNQIKTKYESFDSFVVRSSEEVENERNLDVNSQTE